MCESVKIINDGHFEGHQMILGHESVNRGGHIHRHQMILGHESVNLFLKIVVAF